MLPCYWSEKPHMCVNQLLTGEVLSSQAWKHRFPSSKDFRSELSFLLLKAGSSLQKPEMMPTLSRQFHCGSPSASAAVNCWQPIQWLKWLLNEHKPPCIGLLPLSLSACSPWQSASATGVAQRNAKAQLTFKPLSAGRHLSPLKHPWISTRAECPSSAKWLAVISLDLREAFCINPDCATSALCIKRFLFSRAANLVLFHS